MPEFNGITMEPALQLEHSQDAHQPSTTSGSKSIPYGYCNAFTTHSLPIEPTKQPPSYRAAQEAWVEVKSFHGKEKLPAYTCTVHHEGIVGIQTEMLSPFIETTEPRYHDVYAIINGTQLNIYKLKSSLLFGSKEQAPNLARRIRSYTLQHAEVGVAIDHRPEQLIPKSSLARFTPVSFRQKLYEADPSLFEPVREWTLRLRAETEQLLFSVATQEELLTWVEQISQAIDLAPPLDDRSDPKYRSIPRRSRRQRRLEGLATTQQSRREQEEEQTRRLIRQQERVIRRLYPHLANGVNESRNASNLEINVDARQVADSPQASPHNATPSESDEVEQAQDEMEEIYRHRTRGRRNSLDVERTTSRRAEPREPYNPKTATPRERSPSALLRYRRRCAPILLFTSPRCSNIVIYHGRRMCIDAENLTLVPFVLKPPKYDSGDFKGGDLNAQEEDGVDTAAATSSISEIRRLSRPSLGARNLTEMSILSTVSTESSTSIVNDDLTDAISTISETSPSATDTLSLTRTSTNATQTKHNSALSMKDNNKSTLILQIAPSSSPFDLEHLNSANSLNNDHSSGPLEQGAISKFRGLRSKLNLRRTRSRVFTDDEGAEMRPEPLSPSIPPMAQATLVV